MQNLIVAVMLSLALALTAGPASASPADSTPAEVGRKDGDGYILCVEELGPDEWVMRQWDEDGPSCRFALPLDGVFVRLDYGEMLVTPHEGVSTECIARVYTAGAPFEVIGDGAHLIASENIVDVVVQKGTTYILSKEGKTDVISCERAQNPSCVKRGFLLLEGDLLGLESNGDLCVWEDSSGQDLRYTKGGCNAAAGYPKPSWPGLAAFLLTALWLLRRRKKRPPK